MYLFRLHLLTTFLVYCRVNINFESIINLHGWPRRLSSFRQVFQNVETWKKRLILVKFSFFFWRMWKVAMIWFINYEEPVCLGFHQRIMAGKMQVASKGQPRVLSSSQTWLFLTRQSLHLIKLPDYPWGKSSESWDQILKHKYETGTRSWNKNMKLGQHLQNFKCI